MAYCVSELGCNVKHLDSKPLYIFSQQRTCIEPISTRWSGLTFRGNIPVTQCLRHRLLGDPVRILFVSIPIPYAVVRGLGYQEGELNESFLPISVLYRDVYNY